MFTLRCFTTPHLPFHFPGQARSQPNPPYRMSGQHCTSEFSPELFIRKIFDIKHTNLANLIVTDKGRVRLIHLDLIFRFLSGSVWGRWRGWRVWVELNEPFPKSIKVENSKYHCLLQYLTIGYLQKWYKYFPFGKIYNRFDKTWNLKDSLKIGSRVRLWTFVSNFLFFSGSR